MENPDLCALDFRDVVVYGPKAFCPADGRQSSLLTKKQCLVQKTKCDETEWRLALENLIVKCTFPRCSTVGTFVDFRENVKVSTWTGAQQRAGGRRRMKNLAQAGPKRDAQTPWKAFLNPLNKSRSATLNTHSASIRGGRRTPHSSSFRPLAPRQRPTSRNPDA